MSDVRANPPRVSTLRIVGALLVVLGVLWFALPFWLRWFFAGPGMPGPTLIHTEFTFSPWPHIGLIIILFGLGFLGIARSAWLPAAVVALAVWIIALINLELPCQLLR
jgi:hypothetical protein